MSSNPQQGRWSGLKVDGEPAGWPISAWSTSRTGNIRPRVLHADHDLDDDKDEDTDLDDDLDDLDDEFDDDLDDEFDDGLDDDEDDEDPDEDL